MKKQQWITIIIAVVLLGGLYVFGRTKPQLSPPADIAAEQHRADDGHNHNAADGAVVSIDTLLSIGKSILNPDQLGRLNRLETDATIASGAKKLRALHRLSHFWKDTARVFELYGWYEAESARLENSEKSLTFAAHLFLENLQHDPDPQLVRWKAMQAKDLFERSLKLNSQNDSSKVGLGACYLFGNISPMPMEGISKIKEVVDRDSTHVFGQLILAKGALLSNQTDKAILRLQTIIRLQPPNIEAIMMLADAQERAGNKASAISWYKKAQELIPVPQIKEEIEKRINELSK